MADSAANPHPVDDLYRRRARSFGTVAAAYAEHRPDYPQAAARWGLEPVGVSAEVRVLDLAAGTGKLTDTLVGLGVETLAAEPDVEMLAELRRRHPELNAFTARAEDLPLPDECVDAVLVGQAFHWFDAAQAVPEIARVLRHGGVLAALWNADDVRVEWVRGLNEVARSPASSEVPRVMDTLERSASYGPVEWRTYEHTQRRTVESLVQTLATHSHIAVLAPAERDAHLDRIRAYLRSRPETSDGEFELPIETRVCRALRI